MKYLVVLLSLVIVVGGILLFTLPTPNKNIKVTLLEVTETEINVAGFAKGTWFFEGDAPLILVDGDYNIISESYITSTEDWMTEEFVPFTGIIELGDFNGEGTLIFKKDNPSDLPKFDDSLEIKI